MSPAFASLTLFPFVSKTPPPAPSGSKRADTSAVLPLAQRSPPPFKEIWPVPNALSEEKPMKPSLICVVPPLNEAA